MTGWRLPGVKFPKADVDRDDADDTDDADGDSFTLESDNGPIGQRLTRRQKALRGGLASLVVFVTAFFILGGPAAAEAFVRGLNPPRPLTYSESHNRRSELAVLPAPGEKETPADVRISPAAGNRGDAYACWAGADSSGEASNANATTALHVAVLPDVSAMWKELQPPVASATYCAVTADTARESWLALAVYGNTKVNNQCGLPDLFLSTSSGASWMPIRWPNQWITACNVNLSLTDGHLYLSADDPLLIRNAFEVGAPERIVTTADEGRTWQVADVGLPFASSINLVGLRPGGHVLVETTDKSQAATGTLWESDTNGASWHSLGELPGADPVVAVSTNPTVTGNGGWGRIYDIAQTRTDGVPDGLNSPQVETAFPGGTWTPLKLPAPIAGNGDSFVNEIEGAVVGPDNSLTVLRVAPSATLNTVAPANFVWTWNPAQRTWHEASFVIPSNTIVQGTAWGDSQMRMWMTEINMGVPISVTVRTFTLTAVGAM